MWASRGNVPALSRLLCSIIPRGAGEISANNQIESVLGVFQSLITKKTKLESYGFDILESVILSFNRSVLIFAKISILVDVVADLHVSSSQLVTYFPEILRIIYGRLDSPTVTEPFKIRFTRFYHLVSALYDPHRGYGADYFIAASDSVQDGLFVPLYLKIILPLTQQLARPLHRKCAAISLTKTLTHSEKFAVKYIKGWAYTCEALIKLLELAPLPVVDDSIVVEQDVDDLSFGVGFTPLNACKPQPRDVWPEVTDIKAWVGTFYADADRARQGELKNFAMERLSPNISRTFFSYLNLSRASFNQ